MSPSYVEELPIFEKDYYVALLLQELNPKEEDEIG